MKVRRGVILGPQSSNSIPSGPRWGIPPDAAKPRNETRSRSGWSAGQKKTTPWLLALARMAFWEDEEDEELEDDWV